VGNRQLI
jgi:hypothetical protein